MFLRQSLLVYLSTPYFFFFVQTQADLSNNVPRAPTRTFLEHNLLLCHRRSQQGLIYMTRWYLPNRRWQRMAKRQYRVSPRLFPHDSKLRLTKKPHATIRVLPDMVTIHPICFQCEKNVTFPIQSFSPFLCQVRACSIFYNVLDGIKIDGTLDKIKSTIVFIFLALIVTLFYKRN